MQQIMTNPSIQRSLIQKSIINSELDNYLKLIIGDKSNSFLIFKNMEYHFSFYDANYGFIRSIVGFVDELYDDQIKVKYISEDKHSREDRKNPPCECLLTPDESISRKYNEPIVYFIPICNITEVKYTINNKPDTRPEEDVRVMLLGISATMVKAIVIRMEFFDDSIEDAIKYVDLEANGIYDITYESNDGAIYESRVKVIRIEEDGHNNDCKPGKGYVREHVGTHNSIYTSSANSKNDFMNNPPMKKVKIIVDTSETFTGRYEVIMLDTIRDCILVEAPDNAGPSLPPPINPDDHHNNKCNSYIYTYENKYKAVVNGDKVCISVKGEDTNMSLNELIKFYLGVD